MNRRNKYLYEKTRGLNIERNNLLWSNSNKNVIKDNDNCYLIKKGNICLGAFLVQKRYSSVYLTVFFYEIFVFSDLINHLSDFIFSKFIDCEVIRFRITKDDIIGNTFLKLSSFKLELTRRKHYKLNGKYYDICYYSRYKFDV